jgi:hypothetical protein
MNREGDGLALQWLADHIEWVYALAASAVTTLAGWLLGTRKKELSNAAAIHKLRGDFDNHVALYAAHVRRADPLMDEFNEMKGVFAQFMETARAAQREAREDRRQVLDSLARIEESFNTRIDNLPRIDSLPFGERRANTRRQTDVPVHLVQEPPAREEPEQ